MSARVLPATPRPASARLTSAVGALRALPPDGVQALAGVLDVEDLADALEHAALIAEQWELVRTRHSGAFLPAPSRGVDYPPLLDLLSTAVRASGPASELVLVPVVSL